ncbi:hypothetical protein CNEO2_520007 [Clostridium neonatale]|nr:hypothetical protein CNEO2_520007 [Clostridium neonatale]
MYSYSYIKIITLDLLGLIAIYRYLAYNPCEIMGSIPVWVTILENISIYVCKLLMFFYFSHNSF